MVKLSHADNYRNSFLLLAEVLTDGIDESFGTPQKNFNINSSKAKIKFCLSCITMVTIVTCVLAEKISASWKQVIKKVKFPSQFCLRSISTKFDYVDAEQVFLKENVYDFAVHYDAFDKSDILNIHIQVFNG